MSVQNDLLWKLVESAMPHMDDQWQADYQELLRTPVNPDASKEAQELLSFLYKAKGKHILSGQHEYLEDPNGKCSQVYAKTGVYPMVKGVEFGGITGQSDETLYQQRQVVVNAAIAWHKTGGIVTATYHATIPGQANVWDKVQTGLNQLSFNEIVTPGTPQYNALIEDIDQVAEHLKVLRDAGIPILWRPYHEMNGGWFWWGAKTNFSDLWEIMYDRYTNFHGLNNLLWVWAPNASLSTNDKASGYYVGHNRVDVLGMDIYNGSYSAEFYYELKKLGRCKPFAITENGQLPSMIGLWLKQPEYSWFLTWGSYLTGTNSDAVIKATFSSPYVLNRGETLDTVKGELCDTLVGNGAYGNYYAGKNFDTFKTGKVVPAIDFNWYGGTPIGVFTMSAIWGAYLKPRYSEEYTIHVNASDGVRLTINGERVIDDWTDHATRESTATIKLEAGKYYYIKLEYYNNGDKDAQVHLLWSSASQTKEVIPQTCLYNGL